MEMTYKGWGDIAITLLGREADEPIMARVIDGIEGARVLFWMGEMNDETFILKPLDYISVMDGENPISLEDLADEVVEFYKLGDQDEEPLQD